MKALPCRNRACNGEVAVLPGGTPYFIGRAPQFPFTYRCFRCNVKTTITAAGYAMLPDVDGELEKDAKPAPMRDLVHGKGAA